MWLISTSPTPTSLVQAEDGATWSLGTDIKGSREACYLEVQWQTPAVAVPLISPSSFLPPSLHCLSSSRLVTVLSAACSAVYTRPAWGPGGWRGRHKEGMQKKQKGRFWGASQACRLAANNTRDQFLWTLMSSFSCHTKKTSVGPIHSPDTERQKEKGRGRKSNSYGSNLVSCQETRQGSIHQWQTRQAADWAGWLLLVMCGVIRAKYTNASHVRSCFGIKMWA